MTTNSNAGKPGLKDDFASMIPSSYDLRAPDYRYLMIAELRDFYYSKFELFTKCMELAGMIYHTLHDLYPTIKAHISTIYNHIASLTGDTAADILAHLNDFANDLRNNTFCTPKTLSDVDEIIRPIQNRSKIPLDLQGFKDGPPSSEVTLLPSVLSCHFHFLASLFTPLQIIYLY